MPRLCLLSDIDPETGHECRIETADGVRHVVLLRQADTVQAWLNVCPHMGRSLSWAPGEFLFDRAGRLVCPHHGALFRTEDGECIEGPCRGAALTAVEVEIRGDAVFAVSSSGCGVYS